EHRDGALREVTLQMLKKADELCGPLSASLTAVVLGADTDAFAAQIGNTADEIITVADEKLKTYDVDLYGQIIGALMAAQKPVLTLLGHTPWGMDLAPVLSVQSGHPLGTDAVDILIEDEKPKIVRQIYNGKMFSKVALKAADGYLVTVRPGAFQPAEDGSREGNVVAQAASDLPVARKAFMEFVDTGAGEIDIAQAEMLVSIGRGVGDEDNIAPIKELADRLGASLSCSRPIVDKNWLPKYHQVGTSGKSVKPKVYLALGISGAFQHVAGIAGAGTVIAVNKDAMAPIFRFADYGVVDDLFKVANALKEKLQ
ncbi:MAG: electron transfer flavoprotein subunit alpha/FixB family protein, partial [Deltaproteobacteria bacterium]|nr:electron transfer flavoprotein subunit alpha/FixB family protein [Deltaproteobacteria bacterium]